MAPEMVNGLSAFARMARKADDVRAADRRVEFQSKVLRLELDMQAVKEEATIVEDSRQRWARESPLESKCPNCKLVVSMFDGCGLVHCACGFSVCFWCLEWMERRPRDHEHANACTAVAGARRHGCPARQPLRVSL